MPSTKMFRDRVVSMEQTYEKGEKLLPLLQTLIGEAIPGLTFQEYMLDHEQDCFVMLYRTEANAEKKVSWTRMVLSDPERIPAVVENAQAEIRGRIVEYIRRRSERPFISVTFRHLEDGWVDTPEPKKPKPKPPQPQQQQRQKGQPQPQREERGGAPPAQGRGQQQRGPRERGNQPRPPVPAGPPSARPAGPPALGEAPAGQTAPPEGGGRRRRFRRRRGRGRGKGPGPGAPPAAPPAGGEGAP